MMLGVFFPGRRYIVWKDVDADMVLKHFSNYINGSTSMKYPGNNCIPRANVHWGRYGLVLITPLYPPRQHRLHYSHNNLNNPYRIASIFYM